MTQTATVTEDLTGLDFDLCCQIVGWYILINAQARPACGNPAHYLATVHDFRDCSSRDKYICETCLPQFSKNCSTCGATRLTNLRPIRGLL